MCELWMNSDVCACTCSNLTHQEMTSLYCMLCVCQIIIKSFTQDTENIESKVLRDKRKGMTEL